MNLEEESHYSDIFIGWSGKEIYIAHQMVLFLKKINMSIEEFERFAEHKQARSIDDGLFVRKILFLKDKFFRNNSPECPECGKYMIIQPINISKCTQIDDKRLNSVWTCSDKQNCGHQIWNKKTFAFHFSRMERDFQRAYKHKTRDEIIEEDLPGWKDFEISQQPKCGGCHKEK